MKKSFIGILLFTASTIFSCKKNDLTVDNSAALKTAVTSDTTLSIFNAAIIRASETALLQPSNPVTILAPTNDVFMAAGIDASVINTMPVSSVDSMVKYYFINSIAQPSSSTDTAFTTAAGLPVYGANDGNYTYFNGVIAIPQSSVSGNAALYKINTLLTPPVISITQYLQSDASLSLFNEALLRTGIINNLTNSWHTILAPDNNAFASAGFPDIASIDNADINTLTNIINYHILNAPYFSNNLEGTIAVTTDEGGSTINITNTGAGISITGNNNTSPATVTAANILLSGNIIVHKINTVLMP